MVTVLVERYYPTTAGPSIPERTMLGYIGSIVVPTDETLFSLFHAPSLEAVSEEHAQRRISYERIVECISIFSSRQQSVSSPE